MMAPTAIPAAMATPAPIPIYDIIFECASTQLMFHVNQR